MKIEMKVQISGTRDGQSWPAPGEVVNVPDDEAVALLEQGAAKVPEGVEFAAVDTTPRARKGR